MWCKNCHEEVEEGAAFCPNCGAKIEKGQKTSPKNKTAVAVIAAVLVLAVVAGGVMGFLKVKEGQKAAQKEEQEQTEEQKNKKDDSGEEVEEAGEEAKEAEEETDETEPIESAAPVITAELTGKPSSMGSYSKLTVVSTSATSVVDQEGHDNSADMVVDGKDETSWQEGVDGTGIGEGITLGLDREQKIKYMSLKIGNWRPGDYYEQNNRPKMLEIRTDSCTSLVTFPDRKEEFWLEFSEECPTSSVEIVIKDVYRGTSTKWNDTCIAGIEMYGVGR